MKKEHLIVTTIALFIVGYVIDQIAPPIRIASPNAFRFFTDELFRLYPFSAVSIAAKSFGILCIFWITLSFIDRQYPLKAVILLFIGAMGELYTLQQLATKSLTTPLEWTLSIAYAGILFLLPMTIYCIKSLMGAAQKKIAQTIPSPQTPTSPTHLQSTQDLREYTRRFREKNS